MDSRKYTSSFWYRRGRWSHERHGDLALALLVLAPFLLLLVLR